MEENENTLEKAVEALKNEQIPPGPPQEVTESTITKLTEATGQSDIIRPDNRIRIIEGLKSSKSLAKIAAAAVLLIRAALEPKIRQNLLDETRQYVQLGLANGYIRIRDELSQQYRQELSRVALQSVAASNAVTNEMLIELIESFNEAQSQDRQRIAAALEQIESNRLHDRTQLGNALATLALQTEDELIRTKQDMAHFLSYTQPGQSNRDEIRNSDNPNERTEK